MQTCMSKNVVNCNSVTVELPKYCYLIIWSTTNLHISSIWLIHTGTTVVPVFSGLCDQGTPAVSGQYNDVRGDFQYKLTRDQGTPANADADSHLSVIFAPQPGDSALFILFFITLGRKRYQISLLMRIISLKRMSNRLPQLPTPNNNDASLRCASWEKWKRGLIHTIIKMAAAGRRNILTLDSRGTPSATSCYCHAEEDEWFLRVILTLLHVTFSKCWHLF